MPSKVKERFDNIRYKRYNGKGKIGNTRLYTGREYDNEVGLYYNRARYYNPDLGRFISRDPIDISDDVNLYAYVGNNSVMFVDRRGLGKTLILFGEDKTNSTIVRKSVIFQYNKYIEEGVSKDDILIYGGIDSVEKINNILQYNKGDIKEISLHLHGGFNGLGLNNEINKESIESLLPIVENQCSSIKIKLNACLSGVGENSYAQQISDKLGVVVEAPNNFLLIANKPNSDSDFGEKFFGNIIYGAERLVGYEGDGDRGLLFGIGEYKVLKPNIK